MIQLSFLLGNILIKFWIEGKTIYYQDPKQKKIQIIPESNDLAELKKNPRLTKAFTLRGKDLEDYNNAKTEEDIAEIIKRDCRRMTMKLIREVKE